MQVALITSTQNVFLLASREWNSQFSKGNITVDFSATFEPKAESEENIENRLVKQALQQIKSQRLAVAIVLGYARLVVMA